MERKILRALINKEDKIIIPSSKSNNDIRLIMERIKSIYIYDYPFLKNIKYQISSDEGVFKSNQVLKFIYNNHNNDDSSFKIPNNNIYNEYEEEKEDFLEDVNEKKVFQITDNGQSSFSRYMTLDKGVIFEIITKNPNRVISILKNEYKKIVSAEEGICEVEMKAMQIGSTCKVILEFKLTMNLRQFLDHRKKGNAKAISIYKMLTHNGDIPATIVALLAFAYLQKNVKYARDYANDIANGIDGDKHMTYGALVKKNAVCEGYAWAFIRIMNAKGVDAKLCMGTLNGIDHAWAIVKIGDKWYNVDPTLHPQDGYIWVHNFLVSDEKLCSEGYSIDQSEERCYDKTYEDFSIIKQDLNANKEVYIRKGANVELINSVFRS